MKHATGSTAWLLVATFAVWAPAAGTLWAEVIVDFEDITMPAGSAVPADANELPLISQGVVLNRTWNHQYSCCPGGWASSNQTDLTTAGIGNAYSAYALPSGGGARASSNYAVGFDAVGADALITLPYSTRAEGMYVANTTYGYLAVVDGNDGAGFVKGPFGDGDWFKLDVVGVDEAGGGTGSVEFYLADYRNGQSAAVSQWTWIDLTPLGDAVKGLEFELSSTDTGPFGMNTPGYFAVDDLTLAAGPLQPGDADQDLDFDQLDLVRVQIAARYLTGQAATWGDGDWNGGPGGKQGEPPAGNGLFDQLDITAALNAGKYLAGPYAAFTEGGTQQNDTDNNIIRATFDGSFRFAVDDLTPAAVPEPSGMVLGCLAAGLLAAARCWRPRGAGKAEVVQNHRATDTRSVGRGNCTVGR